MKISFNWNKKDKSTPFGFSLQECLTEDEANLVKNLDLEKLIDLDRIDRLGALKSVISESKANMVNSHLENDFILKRQKEALKNLLNEKEDIMPKWRTKIEKKVAELEMALDKKELEAFLSDLIQLKYGVGLGIMTPKQAEKIVHYEFAEFVQFDINIFKAIFLLDVPTSIFQYPIKYINEAIAIRYEFYKNINDINKLKSLESIKQTFWGTEKDGISFLNTSEHLKNINWWNIVLKNIKNFREKPSQKEYINRKLEDDLFENINFKKLNTKLADKLLRIFLLFYGGTHFVLDLLFCGKIPESFLPFSKGELIKLFDYAVKDGDIVKSNEARHMFIETINEIKEKYIDDEIAMKEFLLNISNEKTRDSVISNLENHQFEKIQKLLSE